MGERPLRFKCPDCDRRFHAPSHLKRHRFCHTSERPFQCHICKKGFLQAWHLGRHMTIHTGNKPFQCPECPKTFGSRFEMKTHCNYIHRGIKEHECPICKKMFTLRSNLKVHMRKHTGECHVCLKRFGQRGHLQYHLRKHEAADVNQKQSVIKTTPKEQLTSDYGSELESVESDVLSPKSLPRYSNSSRASSSPTPSIPQSPTTNRRQSVEIPLSGRMFDHTNPTEIKPFVCISCNCGFGEISSLKAHVRHSHVKKGISNDIFSCAYCCETFRDIDVLKYHFDKCKHTIAGGDSRSKSDSIDYRHHTEYRTNQLKRSASMDIVEPSAKRRSPSPVFYTPNSPGALTTTSDTTYDRRLPYQTPSTYYSYGPCPPGCTCLKATQIKRSVSTLEIETVQSRYLSYLENYQKMLESHVQLMEAIDIYRK